MLNLGVEKRKLILGIPFYSRIWTIQGDTLSSYTVGMQDQMNYLNMQNKEWLEDEGQYYVEYTYNNKIVKLWAEESESIAEKVRLSKEYELAGVAAWRRGYETENIWKVIKDNM
jgi:spore germination protein YaaH